MKIIEAGERKLARSERCQAGLCWAVGVAATLGVVGCASTTALGKQGEADFSSTRHHAFPSVRVGEAHVVGTRIDPRAPVRASPEGRDVAVSFTASGGHAAVVRLDGSSLKPLSLEQGHAGPEGATASDASRVTLQDGRFVECWVRGDVEWGHRALAQAFGANGSPLGAPVVLSPPDVDVVGRVHAMSTDGRHVVVTFAAATDTSFEALAVPIDDATDDEGSAAPAMRRVARE